MIMDTLLRRSMRRERMRDSPPVPTSSGSACVSKARQARRGEVQQRQGKAGKAGFSKGKASFGKGKVSFSVLLQIEVSDFSGTACISMARRDQLWHSIFTHWSQASSGTACISKARSTWAFLCHTQFPGFSGSS
jgi:hypothetical protein